MNARNLLIGIAAVALAFGISSLEHRLRSKYVHPAPAQRALAPDFALPDLTGQQLNLSSYRGKVVLLDFWATWCDPCREEIPRFVDLQSKYGSQGLQIIGVSMDDGPDPVREFYPRFKMNYPVVMGDAKIGDLYGGVFGLPVSILIERDGHIYSKHIGATDVSIFEKEIVNLLQSKVGPAQHGS